MVERYPKREYSFPHVRFNERSVGPPVVNRSYRDRIGIVGPFNFGPKSADVSTREEFSSLFGEDDSAGSVAVQQATLQGANNFTISRVIPSSRPGTGSINFIGYESDEKPVVGENPTESPGRTTGLRVDFSYIGNPISEDGTNLGASLLVPKGETVKPLYDDENEEYIYNGNSFLRFEVIEYVRHDSLWDSENEESKLKSDSITIDESDILSREEFESDKYYLLELDEERLESSNSADLVNTFVSNLKPSLEIVDDDETLELEVISYPKVEDGKIKFTVKSKSDATLDIESESVDLFITVEDNTAPSDKFGYHILGYNLNAVDYPGAVTQLREDILTKDFRDYSNFLKVGKGDNDIKNVDLLRFVDPDGKDDGDDVLDSLDTGVQLQFGSREQVSDREDTESIIEGSKTSISGDFVLNQGAKFRIDLLSSYINLGASEDDTEEDAFEKGKTGEDILEDLEELISTDPVLQNFLEDFETQFIMTPISLSFSSIESGVEANRMKFMVTRYVSDSSEKENIVDLRFEDDGDDQFDTWVSLEGARTGLRSARRILYDRIGNSIVLIESRTPGRFGNDIQLSVEQTGRGQFTVNVTYDSSENEDEFSESLNFNNRDIDQSGRYRGAEDSNLIRAFFLPAVRNDFEELTKSILDLTPERIEPPSELVDDEDDPKHKKYRGSEALSNFQLVGGLRSASTNDELSEQDYIDAVERLEEKDVDVIALTGFHLGEGFFTPVINAALEQAEDSSPFNGLRRVVVAAPPNINSSQAERISAIYNDPRVSIVAGWSSFNASIRGINNANPVGYYVGKIATTSPERSLPVSGAINGILSVDLPSKPKLLDSLTESGIDAIYFDNSTRTYRVLNGRTTDVTSSDRWLSIRRIGDHIITNLYRNLAWARSISNTEENREKITSSVDSYLNTLVREGKILSFVPSVSDSSNNSRDDVLKGNINISITYTPVFPADVITVNIDRDITETISL